MSTPKKNYAGIGRDLDIPAGEVAEYVVTGHVENAKGFTFKVKGGGTVILTLSPEAFAARRTVERVDLKDHETIDKVRAVLSAWSQDPEFRGRDYHSEALGVCPRMVSCACDQRPDRASPPMRREYELAMTVRRRRQSEVTKARTGYARGKSQSGRASA